MNRRELAREMKKRARQIENEFIAAVQDNAKGASIGKVETAVAAGSVTAVLRETGLTQPKLSKLFEAIRDTFKMGGEDEAPAARIKFDMRNKSAEKWLTDNSSRLVTDINEGQREAIRQVLDAGMKAGRNPRKTALDIVGRVTPNGRKGGIVGLNKPQAEAVLNARTELASGDPATMNNYFTRKRRDRRFDGVVRKAIKDGKPVKQGDIDKLTTRYSDRLLKLRGDMIGRTESLAALNEARDQAWNQAIEEGVVKPETMTKTWQTAGDGRVRDSHAAMHGQTVGKNELFTSPTGARLDHPGDSEHGADARDLVNCRCSLQYRADYFAS